MNELLYSAGAKYNVERITKWHVEKETPKQYILREMNGNIITGCQRKVNKADMHLNYEGYFCETLEEAKAKRKECIEHQIEIHKNRVEQSLKSIKNLEETLKKFEEEDEK